MKHPPRVTWKATETAYWTGMVRRQPELEDALFEIGEELVGERRLKDLLDRERERAELQAIAAEEREAIQDMGGADLLRDIRD